MGAKLQIQVNGGQTTNNLTTLSLTVDNILPDKYSATCLFMENSTNSSNS